MNTAKKQHRLEHVLEHLKLCESTLNDDILNIDSSPSAYLSSIREFTEAKSIVSWFQQNEITEFKYWCYITSKIQRVIFQNDHNKRINDSVLFPTLMSDHHDLIQWFAHYEGQSYISVIESHKNIYFYFYQFLLAIRGDWDRLSERCNRIISDPPSKYKIYMMEHQYFLALAQGNIDEMQKILYEMVSPRSLRSRTNDESGYTQDLICTPAVICAKIAWLHGYHVEVDTPYIPKEWLPIAPLNEYIDQYDFLKKFDIYQKI